MHPGGRDDRRVAGFALLHAGCAALYAVLAALILVRRPARAAPALWLAGACLVTAAWAAAVAVQHGANRIGRRRRLARGRPLGRLVRLHPAPVPPLGRACTASCARRSPTMGLLALLLVGGLPLIDVLSSQPRRLALVGRHRGPARLRRLQPPAAREPLFQHAARTRAGTSTCSASRSADCSCTTWCCTPTPCCSTASRRRCSRAGASVTALAAPLIAVAAARNRRWDDRHPRLARRGLPQRDPGGQRHLPAGARRRSARCSAAAAREWGYVAEVSLIFAGVLVDRGAADLGLRPLAPARASLVDNFFSHRYDYRREWMRCIDTLTAPDALRRPAQARDPRGRRGGGQPGRRAVRARAARTWRSNGPGRGTCRPRPSRFRPATR